jgi:hypothetical protein
MEPASSSLKATGGYTARDTKFPSGDGGNLVKVSPKSYGKG